MHIDGVGTPAPRVSFPKDEGAHADAKTEWWYLNGHLQDEQGRDYGFVQALFDVPDIIDARYNRDLPFMPGVTQLDLGFTEETAGRHVAQRITDFKAPGAEPHVGIEAGRLDERFVDDRAPWHVERIDERTVHLSGSTGRGAMDLTLRSDKPALLMGGDGEIPMGPFGSSKYYTFSHLQASGTLQVDGETRRVSGTAWMDHQWGDMQMLHGYDGWDWFGIQLDNQKDLNVFRFRGSGNDTVQAAVGESGADGSQATSQQIELTPKTWWTSPDTGIKYPIAWHLVIPDRAVSLDLEPTVPDQEMRGTPPYCHPKLAPIPTYWEGSMRVSGTVAGEPVTGRAYGEMVGYGSRRDMVDLDDETIGLAREKAEEASKAGLGAAAR